MKIKRWLMLCVISGVCVLSTTQVFAIKKDLIDAFFRAQTTKTAESWQKVSGIIKCYESDSCSIYERAEIEVMNTIARINLGELRFENGERRLKRCTQKVKECRDCPEKLVTLRRIYGEIETFYISTLKSSDVSWALGGLKYTDKDKVSCDDECTITDTPVCTPTSTISPDEQEYLNEVAQIQPKSKRERKSEKKTADEEYMPTVAVDTWTEDAEVKARQMNEIAESKTIEAEPTGNFNEAKANYEGLAKFYLSYGKLCLYHYCMAKVNEIEAKIMENEEGAITIIEYLHKKTLELDKNAQVPEFLSKWSDHRKDIKLYLLEGELTFCKQALMHITKADEYKEYGQSCYERFSDWKGCIEKQVEIIIRKIDMCKLIASKDTGEDAKKETHVVPTRMVFESDLDGVLKMLKLVKRGYVFSKDDVARVCSGVSKLLSTEPRLLRIDGSTTVIGDLHSDIDALHYCLSSVREKLDKGENVLFLGDYVDRGVNGMEILMALYRLKTLYPTQVFLLRGNHEEYVMNVRYGFLWECMNKYMREYKEVYNSCYNIFELLPIAAVVTTGEKSFFCVHAGISDGLKIEEIDAINRSESPIKPKTLLNQMLWRDPRVLESSSLGRGFGDAGFTREILESFLKSNNLKGLIRAHQRAMDGVDLPFSDEICRTVFSVPNYCGEGGNSGAILHIDEDGNCVDKKFSFEESRIK